MDAWLTFWQHNKPLFDQMIARGYKFKQSKDMAHFVDDKDKYVPYPKGYITGIGYNDNGTPTPFYASVCLGGSWTQKSFKTSQEAVNWAFEYVSQLTLTAG